MLSGVKVNGAAPKHDVAKAPRAVRKYLQSPTLFGMFMADLSYEKFKRLADVGGSPGNRQQADQSIIEFFKRFKGLLEEIDAKFTSLKERW